MAVADFSLPRWLDQSNTDLVPNAMAKGAAVGASIAHAMQGAAQIRQAQQRIALMQAEDARRQQEFQEKAQAEAMRYQGFQNFARDREILRATGKVTEEQASQQALMKNLHMITAGDPRALGTIVNQSTDNTRDIQRLTDLRTHQTESDRLRAAEIAARAATAQEKETGLNERENLRQKGRVDLLSEKAKTSKVVEKHLSTNDRLAMQAELKSLDSTAEDYSAKVDAINAKYDAIKTGKPTPQQLRIEANQKTIRDNLAKHDATAVVSVISPSGKRGTIPRSQLEDALKQGYKEAP